MIFLIAGTALTGLVIFVAFSQPQNPYPTIVWVILLLIGVVLLHVGAIVGGLRMLQRFRRNLKDEIREEIRR